MLEWFQGQLSSMIMYKQRIQTFFEKKIFCLIVVKSLILKHKIHFNPKSFN